MNNNPPYFYVRVGGLGIRYSGVRYFEMTAIKDFYLEHSNGEHPNLSKLVVTTKASIVQAFYFKEKAVAEKAFIDIKEALNDKDSVDLKLIKQINKHLLHPADR